MPSSIHIDSHPRWGGGQAQSLGLALALAARGEETWFIAQPGSELESRLYGAYLRWEAMPLRGLAGLRSLSRLARTLGELAPDIVHIHESASHFVSGLAARGVEGPRIVVTRRTGSPLRRAWLAKMQYRLWCDRLICVSEAVRSRCREAGLPEALLTVIPDFVDCRHFDPGARQGEARPDSEPTVVTVGRLAAGKGHRVLLRAMREVAKAVPASRLLICGTGEEEAALRSMAVALGISDRVRFLGFARDVREVLARADVFAMPSLSEGLGVAALEAMAMEKPVVASNAGGLRESVVHGETGLIVPTGDAGGLASALIELLSDRGRATRMGREGRQRALDQYDRPRIVERTVNLYSELLTGEHERP